MARIFGNKIGILGGFSGSASEVEVLNFIYSSGSIRDPFTSGSIASIAVKTLTSSSNGAQGELIFRASDSSNLSSKGSPIMRLFHTGNSNEPRVGIGFSESENPLRPLDVKSSVDDTKGTEFLLRSARTTQGALTGDEGGSINFTIDSGSFADITTTGSIAKIKTKVTDIGSGGAQGKLVYELSKGVGGTAVDAFEYGFNIGGKALFTSVQTASLLIKDFSTTGKSSFEMRDYTDNPRFVINDGDVEMSGSLIITGSTTLSGSLTVTDLLNVLANYGQTGSFSVSGSSTLNGDINLDGVVNVQDLLTVLGGMDVSGSTTISGSVEISGSIDCSGIVVETFPNSIVVSGSKSLTLETHAFKQIRITSGTNMDTSDPAYVVYHDPYSGGSGAGNTLTLELPPVDCGHAYNIVNAFPFGSNTFSGCIANGQLVQPTIVIKPSGSNRFVFGPGGVHMNAGDKLVYHSSSYCTEGAYGTGVNITSVLSGSAYVWVATQINGSWISGSSPLD